MRRGRPRWRGFWSRLPGWLGLASLASLTACLRGSSACSGGTCSTWRGRGSSSPSWPTYFTAEKAFDTAEKATETAAGAPATTGRRRRLELPMSRAPRLEGLVSPPRKGPVSLQKNKTRELWAANPPADRPPPGLEPCPPPALLGLRGVALLAATLVRAVGVKRLTWAEPWRPLTRPSPALLVGCRAQRARSCLRSPRLRA